MNVIFDDLFDIPGAQRRFARPCKDGKGFEIDMLRILAPITGAPTPCSPDEPEEGCVVLALEDAHDPARYREARSKAGGDLSRLKIK